MSKIIIGRKELQQNCSDARRAIRRTYKPLAIEKEWNIVVDGSQVTQQVWYMGHDGGRYAYNMAL